MGLLNKALSRQDKWEKDEFLDVIYWLRQIVGLLLGIAFGVLALTGLPSILLGIGINVAVVLVYTSTFQHIDPDEFGGVFEIATEGFKEFFALFLVSWIVAYNIVHF